MFTGVTYVPATLHHFMDVICSTDKSADEHQSDCNRSKAIKHLSCYSFELVSNVYLSNLIKHHLPNYLVHPHSPLPTLSQSVVYVFLAPLPILGVIDRENATFPLDPDTRVLPNAMVYLVMLLPCS